MGNPCRGISGLFGEPQKTLEIIRFKVYDVKTYRPKEEMIFLKTKVFIDGSEGTTGLRIYERFQRRDDIEIMKIDPELRKDPAERKKMINASDVTFLCLPD